MTLALQNAFDQAAKLTLPEQDLLASRLMAEMAAEDAFDCTIAGSGEKLGGLALAALEEFHAGRTEVLDPDRL